MVRISWYTDLVVPTPYEYFEVAVSHAQYDRDHLPDQGWARYRKVGTTRMAAVAGPLTVQTKEGEYSLPDDWRGFIALDHEGYPYPVELEIHSQSYELVSDQDSA